MTIIRKSGQRQGMGDDLQLGVGSAIVSSSMFVIPARDQPGKVRKAGAPSHRRNIDSSQLHLQHINLKQAPHLIESQGNGLNRGLQPSTYDFTRPGATINGLNKPSIGLYQAPIVYIYSRHVAYTEASSSLSGRRSQRRLSIDRWIHNPTRYKASYDICHCQGRGSRRHCEIDPAATHTIHRVRHTFQQATSRELCSRATEHIRRKSI